VKHNAADLAAVGIENRPVVRLAKARWFEREHCVKLFDLTGCFPDASQSDFLGIFGLVKLT